MKLTFKFAALTLIITSSYALTACSSGGSSSPSTEIKNTPVTQPDKTGQLEQPEQQKPETNNTQLGIELETTSTGKKWRVALTNGERQDFGYTGKVVKGGVSSDGITTIGEDIQHRTDYLGSATNSGMDNITYRKKGSRELSNIPKISFYEYDINPQKVHEKVIDKDNLNAYFVNQRYSTYAAFDNFSNNDDIRYNTLHTAGVASVVTRPTYFKQSSLEIGPQSLKSDPNIISPYLSTFPTATYYGKVLSRGGEWGNSELTANFKDNIISGSLTPNNLSDKKVTFDNINISNEYSKTSFSGKNIKIGDNLELNTEINGEFFGYNAEELVGGIKYFERDSENNKINTKDLIFGGSREENYNLPAIK